MNEDTRKIIEETTISMVDVFRQMVVDNADDHKQDMVAILISVLTSINATLIHSFCDTRMKSNKLNTKSEKFQEEYMDYFGDLMMKVGGNTFATCIAKIESLQNREVH